MFCLRDKVELASRIFELLMRSILAGPPNYKRSQMPKCLSLKIASGPSLPAAQPELDLADASAAPTYRIMELLLNHWMPVSLTNETSLHRRLEPAARVAAAEAQKQ